MLPIRALALITLLALNAYAADGKGTAMRFDQSENETNVLTLANQDSVVHGR